MWTRWIPASSTIYYNSYDLASSKNITVQMNELVKAEKCKREIILNYFGYGSPKGDGAEHTCCDYHQGKCCCDDCVISSAAQMMDITDSDVSCAAYSPDAEEGRCIPLTAGSTIGSSFMAMGKVVLVVLDYVLGLT